MSITAIRAALWNELVAITPKLPTAYQNGDFTIPTGPYQVAWLLMARPDRVEMSGRIRREQGIFQIDLKYPAKGGPGLTDARAELIQSAFHDGRTIIGAGVTIHISGPPEIGTGRNEDDRFVVPVKVPFHSNIARS